uniref:hypothetical protein n=1 Tax=Nonomuraea sp. CA-251285 TaxID=3240002 RepID=UPI003F497EEA
MSNRVPAIVATPDTVDRLELVYESMSCGRCSGTGRVPYRNEAGRCFGCGGAGSNRTRAGNHARARFEQLSRALLPVVRDDVAVGDRIFQYLPQGGWGWVRVTGRSVSDMTGFCREQGTIGLDETYLNLRLEYVALEPEPIQSPACAAVDRMGQGFMVPRWDAAKVADIYNEVARLKGAELRPVSDLPSDVSTNTITEEREATPGRTTG